MDLVKKLSEYVDEHYASKWEGSLQEYLDKIKEKPELVKLAHKRVFDMIELQGTEYNEETEVEKYNFFEKELYGINDSLTQIMEYFKAASMGSEVAKRMLLLYGPPSSGKSALLILLKKAIEEYTKTDEGSTFSIANCPLLEEPLHLIPHSLRPDVEKEFGIHIEGDLCPYCNHRLINEFEGDFNKFRVERIFFSEKNRIGIGTFLPSDIKSQNMSELTGGLDLSKIAEFGSEADPRAFRFDGELNKASRGIMEGIELLKADRRFLNIFIILLQEKNIKAERFPLVYCDEAVISHCNESEFNLFMNDSENEALRDRMIPVKVPYTLEVDSEVKIYQKLLKQADTSKIHIAPHTLKAAAMLAVMSRLEPSKKENLTILKKMKLYNGSDDDVPGFTQKDVRLIKKEHEREGMDGISPRFVINRLSSSFTKPGCKCVNAIDILRSIKNKIDSDTVIKPEIRQKYVSYIEDVRNEFDKFVKNDIQKAFFVSFESEIQTLLDNYLDNAQASLDNDSYVIDPITKDEKPIDEKLLSNIEKQIGINETAKKEFRNEILRKVASAERKGVKFDYTTHGRLKEALERALFEERKDTIKITVSSRSKDENQILRINKAIETLVKDYGYCPECANMYMRYCSSLMAK